MSQQITVEIVDEPIKEPSKAWRNLWKSVRKGKSTDFWSKRVVFYEKGQIICGDNIWPSKELAENAGLRRDAINVERNGENVSLRYLCSLPEGEIP